MENRKPGLCRMAVLVLSFCTCIFGRAQESKTLILDAPGADTTAGDYNGTFPSAINNAGAVIGFYVDSNNVIHGFLRTAKGDYHSFQAPGADTTPASLRGTSPSSINDLGVIAGSYTDVDGFVHGFLRSPDGKITSFDIPGGGGYTFPQAINLEGNVAGFYADANFAFHAFLRSPDGKFTTWVAPDECTGNGSVGCYGTGASNINMLGLVAGGYSDATLIHHGSLRTREGKLIPYDVPGAQSTGCPGCNSGLNLWGVVAGTWADANYVNHGYIRGTDGRFTKFDVPGAGTGAYQGTGCSSDCPVSLNDWGLITGNYIDDNNVLHSYMRSAKGKIVTIDPAGSIYTWSSGINDFGAIVGYYYDANWVAHGFLRVPSR
jgi:hypothetical protein